MADNKFHTEQTFFRRVTGLCEQVNLYENPVYQALAQSVIPIKKLESETVKSVEKNAAIEGSAMFKDQLLLALLRWFKYDFFQWVDAPNCPECGGKSHATEPSVSPTAEELKFGALRVEGYQCDSCGVQVRFPRYNDPGKLLETRRGRCGEWANCFTLCAKAMGYDARFVMDWTDHVWTEVWSDHQQRWLHCDPCENVCDKPLLYEKGWNKTLSYVLSFSPDEVIDVTWRYSADFQKTLQRRGECRESRLVDFIHDLNQRKMANMPKEKKDRILLRRVCELAELMVTRKDLKEGETEGRVSGSLQWRVARGEDGAASKEVLSKLLKPEEAEFEKRMFHLTYNCASDEYERPVLKKKSSGWKSCIHSADRIVRKEEFDWKNVYLARVEGSKSAEISWKVNVQHSELKVSAIYVYIEWTTFQTGRVRATCCWGDQCAMLKNGENKLTEDLSSAKEVTVKVDLGGGEGNCAWQHAQLFRAIFGSNKPLLEVKISFE